MSRPAGGPGFAWDAVLLIGDPAQAQPMGAGGVFGFLARSMPTTQQCISSAAPETRGWWGVRRIE